MPNPTRQIRDDLDAARRSVEGADKYIASAGDYAERLRHCARELQAAQRHVDDALAKVGEELAEPPRSGFGGLDEDPERPLPVSGVGG